jgi:hypothetical protein
MLIIAVGGFLAAATSAAQPPPGPPPGGGRGNGPPPPTAAGFVARMMRFDDNQDGKLVRDEVTDPRLQPLLDRADADKNGEVTRDELTALFAREGANLGPGGRGGPPGGPGGPGGGPFGPGGRGMGGPPQLGQILPMGLQDRLGLTDDQKTQVAELQKEVDARLDKILTAEQKDQLKAMRSRGPGGFGPPPGGPGGFDGGPGRPGRGPGPGPGERPEVR